MTSLSGTWSKSSSLYSVNLPACLTRTSYLFLAEPPRSTMPNPVSSAFDHDQGPEAGHLLPYARPIRSVHDLRRILICLGHLLVYGGPVGGAYQDPLVLQFSPQVPSLGSPLRGAATHLAARPVGAGSERLAHGPFGAG